MHYMVECNPCIIRGLWYIHIRMGVKRVTQLKHKGVNMWVLKL